MLNALTSYQFEERPVRVVMVQGEPWFVASDVSAVLGYRNASDMTRNLDEDEKGTHILRTPGGDQSLNIINESGLYNAIFKSRREEAQRFRRWVTGEVLPAIRRHGKYELPPPVPLLPMVAEDIDTARLTAAIGVVREARQIWGPVATRKIWIRLGLPSPLAESEPDYEADPLVAKVAAFIDGKAEVTVSDVAAGLGLDDRLIEIRDRRRIGAALRLLGWPPSKEWRNHTCVSVYRPIPRVQAEG